MTLLKLEKMTWINFLFQREEPSDEKVKKVFRRGIG